MSAAPGKVPIRLQPSLEHHAAEIVLLRDLYRVLGGGTR
jgi:hypothetical protein